MTIQHATFAAGCFWGVEEDFRVIPGVVSTEVGYTGGYTTDPTYYQVCGGHTNHAEAVHITFDDKKISYEKLLDAFWEMHDPTTVDRQGPDYGSQYRSVIFYHNASQKLMAEKSLAKREKEIGQKIVTQIVSATAFYRAEEHHQLYVQKRRGFGGLRGLMGL